MPVNIVHRNSVQDNSERIITGLHSFDRALATKNGDLGIPLRTFWEITGNTGVGKTQFALSLLGMIGAKTGQDITLVDLERQNTDTLKDTLDGAGFSGDLNITMFDPKERIEELLTGTVEEILEEHPNLVMLDSVGAIVPTAELEGEIGDANVGAKGRIVGQWSRKVIRALMVSETPTALFYTNHRMQTFGVKSFVPIYHTTGGTTKKYLATQAIILKAVYGQEFKEDGAWLIEGLVDKNRDGFTDKKFNVFMVGGEGIHFGLTALFDCVMSKLAKIERGVVTMDGQKYGRIRAIIKNRHSDPDFFNPFINALRSQGVSEEVETEDEEPENRGKK